MDPASSTNPTSEPTSEPTKAENVSGVSQAESAAPVTLAGVSEPIETATSTTEVDSALAGGESNLAAEQGRPSLEERLKKMVESISDKIKSKEEALKIGPYFWKPIFSRADLALDGGHVLEAHEIDGVGCLVRSRTLSGKALSEALVLVRGVECKPRSSDPKDGHELLPIGFKP